MPELIDKIKQIKDKLDFNQLKKEGIRRERREYEFIVTYPSIPAMKKLNQEDIFSNKNTNKKVQFYIHLPFCTGTCSYCGRFLKFPNQSQQIIDTYINYLKKEWEIMKSIPELQDMKVGSLYFGGGTPTYLNLNQLSETIKYFISQLNIIKGAEFTVEGSPETLNKEKLKVMRECGVNRISIGVQSFHDDILKLCGRRHDAKRAKEISNLIKKAGFDNFNIDLMVGLPLQTLKKWEEDLRSAVDSGASCVTTYPLYIRPGCGMYKFSDNSFPTEEGLILMEIMTKEFFSDLGWKEDPVHFFTSPEKISVSHNIKKWEGSELIGLGVSTYQFMNNIQYHNYFDMERYKKAIDSGRLPIWLGKKLDKNEQMARIMVLGMKRGKIDKKSFEKRFGSKPEDIYPEILKRLQNLGLIEINEDEIKLSYKGTLFSEEVAIQFLTEETKKAYERNGAKYSGYSIAELPKC